MEPILVSIDTEQARIKRDRIGTLVAGEDWNVAFAYDVIVEPVTQTLMLAPLPLTDAWRTSHTGDYARFAMADYSLITPSKWAEGDKVGDGHSNYLYSLDVNEVVQTTSTYGANRGIYLSFFASSSGNERHVQIEFGWGDPGVYVQGVSCRVWSDGHVEVWKDGYYVGTGSISGRADDQQQHLALKTTDIYAVPYRNRELLIFSNQGGAFRHTFDDLEENVSNIITPDEKLWWYVPEGDAVVQCAPLRFTTAGSICSRKVIFATAPASGSATVGQIYADGTPPTWSLVEPDGASPFTPNGSDKECRVKVNFTAGSGTSSPFVYGVTAGFDAEVANTNGGDAFTLNPYITRMSLDVPEQPSGVELSITLKEPEALETTEGVALVRRMSNRAVSAQIGSQTLLDGRTEPPEWNEAIDDTARRLMIKVRDHWKAFENYLFSDPYPLDGMNLRDAFIVIVECAGFSSSDIDIPAISFNLPQVKSDEWNVLIEVGDSAAEWLERLHDTYCATYVMGWFPTAAGFKFRVFLHDPDEAPAVALYPLLSDAYDAYILAGNTPEEATLNQVRGVFRKFKETILEPEANHVFVVGRDPRSDRPIVVSSIDEASANPETPVSSRPENWLGEVRKYGWVDSAITTEDAATYACSIIAQRLTPIRRIAEWECDFLSDDEGLIMWRGGVVNLVGYGKYRITSLSADLNIEPTEDNPDRWWRPTTYVGEYIGEAE